MPRDLTPGLLAELSQKVLRPVLFVELETASGFVRVWNGLGSIVWGETSPEPTWTGVGKLGSISPIGETAEVRAEGVRLGLSGIPADMITLAMTDALPGKSAKIWLGMMTDAGVVIADPFLAFAGRTDAVEIEEGSDTSTIFVAAESELIRLHQATQRRYTHEDQQEMFPPGLSSPPGEVDRGFEYVESIQDINLNIGRAGAPPFTPDLPQPEPRDDDD